MLRVWRWDGREAAHGYAELWAACEAAGFNAFTVIDVFWHEVMHVNFGWDAGVDLPVFLLRHFGPDTGHDFRASQLLVLMSG